MPRKGRNFETFVRAIESFLSDGEATVESPAFLEDRITSERREIDVLITKKIAHHEVLIAVECKDWKRNVGVDVVEAFETKTKDLKINKAVIVSSSGFSQNAIEKARHYNISCLTVQEVEKFNWFQPTTMAQYRKEVIKCEWRVDIDAPDELKTKNSLLFHKSGMEVTSKLAMDTALRYVESVDVKALVVDQVYSHTAEINPNDLYFFDSVSQKKFGVKKCQMNLEFKLRVDHLPIRFVKYGDVSEGEELVRAATVELSIDENTSGQLILIEGDGSLSHVIASSNDVKK